MCCKRRVIADSNITRDLPYELGQKSKIHSIGRKEREVIVYITSNNKFFC